jgi:hypothetical protein
MDENLPRLVSELRKETCPQRVLEEVARCISAQTSPPSRFRYGVPAMVTGLVLSGGLAVWWQVVSGNRERQANVPKKATYHHAQIAQQAEDALGIIGSVLLTASAHSEKVIFNRAVPPLRNSLETAKHKIINRIEL